MKIIKKIISLLLVVLFTVSGFAINASAATTTETESNDTFSKSDLINTNTLVSGNLQTTSDIDYYKFTITENGYISLYFAHEYIDDTWNFWEAMIFDSNYQPLMSRYSCGNISSLTSTNLGLNSGTYYIRIKSDWRYSDIKYNFKIIFTKSNAWETEKNDSFGSANNINLNTAVNGSIVEENDIDYYKFTMSSNNEITIKFNHEYINDSWTCWRISLFDSSYNLLNSFDYNGQNSEISTNKISLKSGNYFIKAEKFNHYYDIQYSLKIVTPSLAKYNVTYNANGGSVSPSSSTVNAGSSVTLPTPTRSGYTCLGWSTSSTATSASYSCGAKYTPSKSITLYAVWKQNPTTTYKVTYNANGGSVSPSSSTVNAGSSVTLPTPTKSGYTCLGWSTSSTATSASYSCGAKYTPSKSITLYAVWKQNSTQIESITLNYKDNYYLGYYDFKPVKYYSDNAKVATVSDSGEIYATCRGRTYVHAVDYYGNERVTEVNVNYAWWQWIIKIVLFGWIWY